MVVEQRSGLPVIHSAKVFGVRPHRPLLHRIAASGLKPLKFEAERLPSGVTLNPVTGVLSGTVCEPGAYDLRIEVSNAAGRTLHILQLKVGFKFCLTPPMGWNSWNCHADKLDHDKVISAANAMHTSGLADFGWTYINIDDGWQGRRGGPYNAIQPNANFPDMRCLCAEVHALGLKVGIYSTPWRTSYAGKIGGSSHAVDGSDWSPPAADSDWSTNWHAIIPDHYIGPYVHDYKDARQWADWGIDYLKYDWCPNDMDSIIRMWRALDSSGRDVVLSLSNNCPKSIALDVGGYANAWRTTPDLHDYWHVEGVDGTGQVHGILNVWDAHKYWQPFTAPGSFADPDMLVLGKVGWGTLRPTRLNPMQQQTHFALWCLLSAPLLIGCPLDDLDSFTFSLLSNPKLIAINQDPLCSQPRVYTRAEGVELIVKPLLGGDFAIGLFNRGNSKQCAEFSWQELGLDAEIQVQITDCIYPTPVRVVKGAFGSELEAFECKVYRLAKLG
ncbi:MAG: putative Ig domain-containing protein [Verrucomicrobia bacterium]|nr:putative Ig domain-containing protein [Verrucomicrobiota bacterium]